MRMLKLFFCLVFLASFAVQKSQAQVGVADISKEMIVQVNEDQVLSDTYEFSIDHLTFPSEGQAQELFDKASEHKIVNFILDYASETVILELDLSHIDTQYRNVAYVNRHLEYYSNYIKQLYE